MTLVPKTLCLVTLIMGLTTTFVLPGGKSQTIQADMPVELHECVQLISNTAGDANLTTDVHEDIYIQCLQQFVWKEKSVQWNNFNITENDKRFINSLIGSFIHRNRQKRTPPGPSPGQPTGRAPGRGEPGERFPPPETGSRIRREYRMISDRDRAAFHQALNTLKRSGQYDTFANLHTGIIVYSAHTGPNFFGWHRIFLILLEEAIRKLVPWLSIPYWDSTLDYDMPDPVYSIIWTETFLGNANGLVVNGPFANWMAPGGPLRRNIGARSRMLTKEVIRKVLTRCRTRDIVYPTARYEFDFEGQHGGTLLFTGGHVIGINTVAFDPAAYLHIAFLDYIWEEFRIRQAKFCGINPALDYPRTPLDLHAAERTMDRFSQYINLDGYSNFWTRYYYRYERWPSCSMWRPFCGSKYLRCDMKRNRCVSKGRSGGKDARSMVSIMRARAQEAEIDYGVLFRGPKSEPRTHEFRFKLTPGRIRRAANHNVALKENNPKNNTTPPSSSYGPIYKVSSFDGNSSTFRDGMYSRGVIDVYQDFVESSRSRGSEYPVSELMKLLPVPDYHETSVNDMLKHPVQNTFVLNGHADITKWAFIPVNVIYKSYRENHISTLQNNKNTSTKHAADSSKNSRLAGKVCAEEEADSMKIRIQSSGLNYNGEYFSYAVIDRHLPVDSATTYIGIKSPEVEYTEVILSAVHSCGTMCQAHCLIPDSVPTTFKPCSGVLKISNNEPNVYGRTYEEAVSHVLHASVSGTGMQNSNLRIFFDCSSGDKSLWPSDKKSG